jgi:hypothetical protein
VIANGCRMGISMVLAFGQEPGMTKLCRAVKANWPAEAVRKGELDGRFPCTMRYQPSCSPSCPMTDPISGTSAASPFVAKARPAAWRVPRTTSVNVAARAIASSNVDTLAFIRKYAAWRSATTHGNVYLHGSIGPALKAFKAPFADSAWSCSCC